jgi:hypothetical protein
MKKSASLIQLQGRLSTSLPKRRSLRESKSISVNKSNNRCRIYRAKRAIQETSIDEESKTQANSDHKTNSSILNQDGSQGSLNLFPGLSAPKPSQAPITFKFTLGTSSILNNSTKGNAEESKALGEEEKELSIGGGAQTTSFFKIMKLNDEKKFFINKNLFENTAIPQLKPVENKPRNETPVKTMPVSDKRESAPFKENSENLIQKNPLNSATAIQLHKDLSKDHESPIVKSLFEFKENAQFKQNAIAPTNTTTNAPALPSIKNLFGEPGSKEKKITIKPFFSTANPFNFTLKPSGQSSLFSTTKSLFSTSDLAEGVQPTVNPIAEKEDSEEPLADDIKENVQSNSNSQFEKKFQKQVEKLKLLKGITDPERKPSKKDMGYLSIESKNTPPSTDDKPAA